MRKPATAAVVLFASAVLVWQLLANSHYRMLFGDFRAFYCGGSVVLHADDPYASAPILRCEQVAQPFGLHSARDAVDLPAPFPGYTLAIFAIFALLPYVASAAVWLLLLLACTAAGCAILARMLGKSDAALVAAVAAGFAVAAIPYGELAPAIFCALAAAASLLRARGVSLGFCVALAVVALLPHAALPVFAALFIWRRDARLPIVAIGVVLLALDLAVGGPARAISYLTHVLPNHAASEIGFVTQYSLTWAAQGLGASNAIALVAGNISYALMCVAGVWLGGLLARRYREPAFLIFFPAACAVTFGSFIHYSEVLLALPAALLLLLYAPRFATPALLLIAIPWQSIVTQPALIAVAVLGVIAISLATIEMSPRASLYAGLAATGIGAIIIVTAYFYGPQTAPHAGPALDRSLAEATWAEHIARETWSGGIVWWIAKLPTWIGLSLLVLGGAFAAVNEKRVTPVAVEHAPAGL